MKKSGIEIIVYGKVQGVFFRKYTRDKAKKLRLKGFVQNLYGGEVKIQVFGDEKDLAALINWCYIGSPQSEVERVETREIGWKEYSEFDIVS